MTSVLPPEPETAPSPAVTTRRSVHSYSSASSEGQRDMITCREAKRGLDAELMEGKPRIGHVFKQ